MKRIVDQKIPLSLYIHIPWCIRKCPYCDFNSYPMPQEVPETAYLNALISDLNYNLDNIKDRKLHSIFIGGGTPTLWSANTIAKLLDKISGLITFENNIEISIEANPGTITKSQLQTLYQMGINRLSLGVQSFQNDKLKILGRIHGQQEAIHALTIAQEVGFTNINIDMMYGLPKQTMQDIDYDLQMALSLQPTHLSWYQLTIEPNTIFYKKQPNLPNEDLLWEIQQQGQQIIADSGFKQYEISAYSKPNLQCQHNLNYWQFGDYLGIGAGAHSKITINNIITRISKLKHPTAYITNFINQEEIITQQDIILEFMLNALRLTQPLPTKLFTDRTGFPITAITQQLDQAQKLGFIKWDQKNITTTALGKNFLNELLMLFCHKT